MQRDSICLWLIRPELVIALAQHFGDPVDAYVNGSQVWHRDHEELEISIEYRLHPTAHFVKPEDVETFDLFPLMALGLANNELDDELPAPLSTLWDGLEAYVAFGNDVEPARLCEITSKELTISPDFFGQVDHQRIGDDWERSGGKLSIVHALRQQLES